MGPWMQVGAAFSLYGSRPLRRRLAIGMAVLTVGLVAFLSPGCGEKGTTDLSGSSTSMPPSSSVAPQSTTTSSLTSTTSLDLGRPAKVHGAMDVAAYMSEQGPGWFEASMGDLPPALEPPETTMVLSGRPLANRRDGAISPRLIASYLFLQFGEIGPADLAKHAGTLDCLFIRSALLGFVDYLGGRVFDWDGRSSRIPLDLRAMIKEANKLSLPVFIELNYSDYIPGPVGSGTESLVRADNAARTVSFIQGLEADGLHVEGVTFGDEIGDDNGYGPLKPTFLNSDIVSRFVTYAKTLREHLPGLKIYAFDSNISAANGRLSESLDLLRQLGAAEVAAGTTLIDGFVFRESYVYMDQHGKILDSQAILDDIDSLAGAGEVTRFDVMGVRHGNADRAYLPTLVEETRVIFGRELDLGITEYLPAGPLQISESDTSVYADIDFLIHYADLVGTYAEQGLDIVSSWIFANDPDQAKCYVDKEGNEGLNYPVHEQLARHFTGSLLEVQRSEPYKAVKVRLYAARDSDSTFVIVLNKDTSSPHTVRVVISGEYDLVLRLPPRSYTSLLLEADSVTVRGIGGGV